MFHAKMDRNEAGEEDHWIRCRARFYRVVFLRNLFNGTDGLLGLSQLKSRHDTIERSF